MEKPLVSAGIDPCALSPNEKSDLASRLYKVHCEIFEGVDFEEFKGYIFAPGADRTRIYTFCNSEDQLVGYIAVHNLLIQLEKRRIRVLKTEVGLLRRYRGNNSSLGILFREGLRAWFRNGFRNLWFVATPVHPNPYCAVARQMHEMYPRFDQEVPSRIGSLMDQISQQLTLKRPSKGSRWVRKVGWRVRNTSQESKSVKQSKDPHVQFYLKHNASYSNGNGLMILVPCHPPNAISAIWNLLRKTTYKQRVKFDARPETKLN